MPEPANSTALAVIDGEYQISVKEFDAGGGTSMFKVPVPTNISSNEASVMLRSAILKRTTWKSFDFPTILHAVIYADRMGLDIMAGDVYSAEGGRLSTTAGAKIRHAMSSGKIKGYTVEITEGPEISIEYSFKGGKATWKGPNLHARVTVHVDGWAVPVVYETTLEEWFMGANPNWKSRPAYMLRRNALSKALEEVAPMGVEADEAPPLDPGVAK
jgi:hypothetical protein